MRILGVELFKIVNRRRSYIGYIAVIVLIILVTATFYYEGTELFGFITSNLETTCILQGTIVNGSRRYFTRLRELFHP